MLRFFITYLLIFVLPVGALLLIGFNQRNLVDPPAQATVQTANK